jgi:antitoxin PrlF
MAYTSTVSSKGQVTVPQEVRTRLGLKTGDRLEFVMEGGQMIIRPARTVSNPFKAYVGALGTFSGGEPEIAAWLAELRDEEPPHPRRRPAIRR